MVYHDKVVRGYRHRNSRAVSSAADTSSWLYKLSFCSLKPSPISLMCELISWLMAVPEDPTRSLLQVHDPQLVRQTVEARTISWVSDLLLGYLPQGVFVLGHLLRLSIVEHRGRPTSAAWNSLRSASAGLSGCKGRASTMAAARQASTVALCRRRQRELGVQGSQTKPSPSPASKRTTTTATTATACATASFIVRHYYYDCDYDLSFREAEGPEDVPIA